MHLYDNFSLVDDFSLTMGLRFVKNYYFGAFTTFVIYPKYVLFFLSPLDCHLDICSWPS